MKWWKQVCALYKTYLRCAHYTKSQFSFICSTRFPTLGLISDVHIIQKVNFHIRDYIRIICKMKGYMELILLRMVHEDS
jgi:hypothetical protein